MGPHLDDDRLYHRRPHPRTSWSQLSRVPRWNSDAGALQLRLHQFGVTYYLLLPKKKTLQLQRHQRHLPCTPRHPHPVDPQFLRLLLSRLDDRERGQPEKWLWRIRR